MIHAKSFCVDSANSAVMSTPLLRDTAIILQGVHMCVFGTEDQAQDATDARQALYSGATTLALHAFVLKVLLDYL